MRTPKIYALYHGDKFIDMGTADYLAKLIGVQRKTIIFYGCPSYRKRIENNPDRYIVIEVKDDE